MGLISSKLSYFDLEIRLKDKSVDEIISNCFYNGY